MHTFFKFASAIGDVVVVVVVAIAVDASVVCIVVDCLAYIKRICQNFMLCTLLLSLSLNGRYMVQPESTSIHSLSNGAHMVLFYH